MADDRRLARRTLLWFLYVGGLATVLFLPYAFKAVPLAVMGKRIAIVIIAGLAIGLFLAVRVKLTPPKAHTLSEEEAPRKKKRIHFPAD